MACTATTLCSASTSPILIARIAFGAIRHARGLGFGPHADFAKAAGHLREWDGVCDLEFGRDGMPIPGRTGVLAEALLHP
jgi:hypothetical protein